METVRVPLTRGLEAVIDAADAPLILAYKWFALNSGRGFYAARDTRKGAFLMHRVLSGAQPGQIVDHINGDKLDNRRVNLRVCDSSLNNHNQAARGRSGFKGVARHSKNPKWCATISERGRVRYLGSFDLPEDAARAYDAAAKIVYGASARLNFPEAA